MSAAIRWLLVSILVATVHCVRRITDDCYAECTALYDPVCGSDGQTYNNECELTALARCRGTTDLRKVKDRPCDVGTVVLLDTYEWNIRAPKVKIGAKSAVTINVQAELAKGSDNLSGRNLWRVGVFGSEWPDGYGEKTSYVEQILSIKQASKNVKKGKPLKIKNIRSRFDLSQIGCGPVAYFCVELARNEESSEEFELRAGILLDSIVACKRLECRRPDDNAQIPVDDLPPTCHRPCPPPGDLGGVICGNNSVQYDSFCEITKAARCRLVPVKFASFGECPPEVLVSTLYWTAVARTSEVNFRDILIDVELYLFNDNIGVNVTGDNLWQVSLYGSPDEKGVIGDRVANVEQALDSQLSSMDLRGGYPFELSFTIPFETYAVGCEEAPYFCLEIKRNPNATRNFVIRKTSRETVVISCRSVPCIPPPSDKYRLMFREVSWNVFADNFRFQAPSDLSLNISVQVHGNSEAILDGRNLWRIGIYGSSDPAGQSGEKLNYIQQVLSDGDAEYSPAIVPGRVLVFPLISTQYDISAVGCGEYPFLCVVLAKGPDAVPDFEIANNENKRKVVSCRRVQCIEQEALPPPPTTARLSYLTWNLTIASAREDGSYNIKIAVNVIPTADTDTVRGEDLWRIGVFLSNATSGVMARSQYQADILTEENKRVPLVRGESLLFTELEAVLNVQGVGCPESSLQYACLELAQGDAPQPPFVLPLGPTGTAHSCRRLFCHQTN